MNKLIFELERIISAMPEKINSLSDMEVKPIPSKWSKKEILGHLCDSGNVNHRRFVDILTSTELVTISGYKQDLLVKIHNYHHSFSVEEVLNLWISLNNQIVRLLTNVSDQQWKFECKIDTQNIQTLEWLVTDYIDHMNHHFKQILAN